METLRICNFFNWDSKKGISLLGTGCEGTIQINGDTAIVNIVIAKDVFERGRYWGTIQRLPTSLTSKNALSFINGCEWLVVQRGSDKIELRTDAGYPGIFEWKYTFYFTPAQDEQDQAPGQE